MAAGIPDGTGTTVQTGSQLAIGERLTRRYLRQCLPDAALEGCALHVQGQCEAMPRIGEELFKLCRDLPPEYGRCRLLRKRPLNIVEPGKSIVAVTDAQPAKGRVQHTIVAVFSLKLRQ